MAAVMTLYDRKLFDLDDPVCKFLPEFSGDSRDKITIRHLLTHVSGLPDQLPENAKLRARHAELAEFVQGAIRTPLLFAPGSRYRYSSMGILLASEVAQRISGKSIATLVDETVYKPLEMKNSALGLGRLKLDALMRCQVENAAPESGRRTDDERLGLEQSLLAKIGLALGWRSRFSWGRRSFPKCVSQSAGQLASARYGAFDDYEPQSARNSSAWVGF